MREARPDDAEPIAHVQVAAWRAAYRGIVPEEHLAALDWRERAGVRRAQLERAGDDGVRVHVSLNTGTVVGFVATGPNRDEDATEPRGQEVYALYLAPSEWSQGHGRALLDRAIADLPSGVPVTLWVLADNVRARAFYERQAFLPDGAEKTITIGGRDLAEVRYRLERLADPSPQAAKTSER